MGLIAPLGVGLLGLLIPVIAMYLLKRRREEVEVSSTFLWERVVQDIEANAPWQRLRRNLLLLLQLLTLLLLIGAVARPFLRTAGASGQSLIVILDGSASMGASDAEGGSRLDAARRETLRLLDSLPPDGRMTLIRAGSGAEVLAAGTRDRVAVEQALAALAPTAADSDISAALSLAGAAAARQPESEIVLLSDGAVTAPGPPRLDAPLRHIPLGTGANNQSISALNLRVQGLAYSLFVQATNHGPETVTRRLLVEGEVASGAPYATAFDLTLAPGARAERVLEGLPPELLSVRATLAGSDLLATDDSAWAVPPPLGSRAVRLVTPGNIFVQTGLALLPDVALTVAAPGSPLTDTATSPALTLLDRTISDTAALAPEATGALLLIAPPASSTAAALGITVTGTISEPVPVPANTRDPLLANVDLSEVAILRAQQMALPAWARPVIVDGRSGAPLLWVGERGGRRIAALAFDLHESDLVLRVAFPLLLSNLVSELTSGPAGRLALSGQARPGEPIALDLPVWATGVTVEGPDGRTTPPTTEGRASFTAAQPGLYTVRWQGSPPAGSQVEPLRVAINLFSPQESTIAPVGEIMLAGSGATGGHAATQPLSGEGRRELWRPLALLALLVLAIEWLVYQRDAIARLRSALGRPGST